MQYIIFKYLLQLIIVKIAFSAISIKFYTLYFF